VGLLIDDCGLMIADLRIFALALRTPHPALFVHNEGLRSIKTLKKS
jgi:hypothetical protein